MGDIVEFVGNIAQLGTGLSMNTRDGGWRVKIDIPEIYHLEAQKLSNMAGVRLKITIEEYDNGTNSRRKGKRRD